MRRGGIGCLPRWYRNRSSGEVGGEFRGGNGLVAVAQINMVEHIARPMLDVSRHVDAKKERSGGIDGSHAIRAEKVPGLLGKYQKLLPARAPGCGG